MSFALLDLLTDTRRGRFSMDGVTVACWMYVLAYCMYSFSKKYPTADTTGALEFISRMNDLQPAIQFDHPAASDFFALNFGSSDSPTTRSIGPYRHPNQSFLKPLDPHRSPTSSSSLVPPTHTPSPGLLPPDLQRSRSNPLLGDRRRASSDVFPTHTVAAESARLVNSQQSFRTVGGPTPAEANRFEALDDSNVHPAGFVNMDLASKFKLEELQGRFFPHVPPDVVKSTFLSFGCNLENSKNYLTEQYGPIPANLQQTTKWSAPKLPEPIPHPSKFYKREVREDRSTEKWVDTGNKVGTLYQKHREEAIKHAKMRNDLFQKATDAYLEGDGKRASEFSKAGRYHQTRMEELQKEAGQIIFDSRNKQFSSEEGREYSRATVDLHGLHRNEAIAALRSKIDEISTRQSSIDTLDVLVGTGHHSHTQKAHLEPTVIDFLRENDIPHRPLEYGGQGGAIRVFVNKKRDF
eukprot:669387_1